MGKSRLSKRQIRELKLTTRRKRLRSNSNMVVLKKGAAMPANLAVVAKLGTSTLNSGFDLNGFSRTTKQE